MNFVVQKDVLLENLRNVASVITPRATYPVLQNAYLEVTDNYLILKATDLDTYIESRVPLVSKKKAGKAIVSGRKLLEAVSQLTAEELTFILKENMLVIEDDGAEYRLFTLAPEEYPELPSVPAGNKIIMHPELLKDCFDRAKFAISTRADRPSITGVYLKLEPNQLEMVATDGFQLALIKRAGNFNANLEAIVPPKAFNAFPKNETETTITADSSRISFSFSNTIIICRLIEGPYPDYQRIIPTSHENYLEVATTEFINVLRRAQVFAPPQMKLVVLELSPKKCVVSAETPEIGIAHHEFPATYKGEEMKIGFNIDLLLPICNTIKASKLRIGITTPQAAVTIQPAEKIEDEELLYLLMPITWD